MKKYFLHSCVSAISIVVTLSIMVALSSCSDTKTADTGKTYGTVVNGTFSNGEKAIANNGTYANGQKTNSANQEKNTVIITTGAADDRVINGTYANGETTVKIKTSTDKKAENETTSSKNISDTYFDYFVQHPSLSSLLVSNYFGDQTYTSDAGLLQFAFICASDRKTDTKKDKDSNIGIKESDVDEIIAKYLNKKVTKYDSEEFKTADGYVYSTKKLSSDTPAFVVLRKSTFSSNSTGTFSAIFDVYSFKNSNKDDIAKAKSAFRNGKTSDYSKNLAYSYHLKWTENMDSKEPNSWYMAFKAITVEFKALA